MFTRSPAAAAAASSLMEKPVTAQMFDCHCNQTHLAIIIRIPYWFALCIGTILIILYLDNTEIRIGFITAVVTFLYWLLDKYFNKRRLEASLRN